MTGMPALFLYYHNIGEYKSGNTADGGEYVAKIPGKKSPSAVKSENHRFKNHGQHCPDYDNGNSYCYQTPDFLFGGHFFMTLSIG